ncbi:MAG: hypothetical protein AB7R55_09275 [Gemmatimonadales bacterium]
MIARVPGRDVESRPRLGVVLSNGWSIKNLLHSGALARLAESFELVAWAPEKELEGLRSMAPRFGLPEIPWEPFHVFQEGAAHQLVRQVQRTVFYAHHDVATERIRAQSSRSSRTAIQRGATRMAGLLGRSPAGSAVLSVANPLRRRLGYRSFYAGAFDRHRPTHLLTGNPVDFREDPFVYEARARGIPVATMVASWDNLTSKGFMCRGFDRILTWNEFMRAEVHRYYPDYRSEQTISVGIPRFDVYAKPLPAGFAREPFLRALGLDPARPMILYANTATRLIPEQPQVIAHLADAIASGELRRDLQVLVRCHPRDPLEPYQALGNRPGVAVWHPSLDKGDVYGWLPDADHLWVLAAMIKHAAVTINPCSTMTLDAAMCDRPVASIAYDGDATKPYHDSIASAYDYSHVGPVVRSGATPLCRSRSELIGAVAAYLNDPSVHRAERRALANELCLADRGPACQRLGAELERWAGLVGARR